MFVVVAEDIPAPIWGAEMSSATTTNAEKKVVGGTFLGTTCHFFFWTTTNGEIKVVGVVGGTFLGSTYHPYHFYFCTARLPALFALAVEWSTAEVEQTAEVEGLFKLMNQN